ncbi:MAG: prolipoprotein diacylglyceryl transferase [Monoglobales bacterium]|jgi:phosphatidylglycerol:prolipoprotein diacylglycerol transferase|uniref:prolipoprotein diacylglyceryl transferase n=1 Tax=Candidatus Ventrimonas sp. TaxID=3048889 RepID=UPI0015B1E037
MAEADISFVHLGITIENLKNQISVFGFSIAYYGIIIGIGMLTGIWVAQNDAKRRGQDPDIYLDFALYGIIFAIIGARLYYVIFEWDMYKDNLLQIFNLRAGGLAIYGGVIGAVLTLIVFTRKRKLSFFSMADSGVLGLITGQIIGRWGNFFNCEAFGGYTDSLLAMRIKRSLVNENMLNADVLNHLIVENGVEYIQVHPTFLYESLWNLGVLMFMLWYRKRKKFDGEMLWIYLAGYGLGRFWIEGLRTDQLILFGTGIAVSQGLSLILVLASVGVLIYHYRRLSERQKEKTSDGDIQGRTGSEN